MHVVSLLGELGSLPEHRRQRWIEYFDSFQNPGDGLFYDPVVRNELYDDCDWWGARHLALHMVTAYTALGARPKHPFRFLEPYLDESFTSAWPDTQDWRQRFLDACDLDNKLMNIGCLLQYQRDYWGDEKAGDAVSLVERYVVARINRRTGMWGNNRIDRQKERSRMIQFSYHLLSMFFCNHDIDHFDAQRILRSALETQNPHGGFGVRANSSACEDIDSIDLLIRLLPRASTEQTPVIEHALRRATDGILLNQIVDGGFVFRLDESFVFGAHETSSGSGESALFPTWFRTLSLAYLANHVGLPNGSSITRCPGYEF